MKVLAQFFWNCGSNGDIEGLFIAEKHKIEAAYGKHVYFGGVLGKHSEIYGDLDEGDSENA